MAEVVTMPKLGFDMAEGTLVRWVKAEGDEVEKGELLAEIETDKATVEVESMYSGVVRKHLVGKGAAVPVGEPIAVVGAADEEIDVEALVGEAAAAGEAPAEEKAPAPQPEAAQAEPAPAPAPAAAPGGDGHLPGGVRASPLARRMADEHGLDLKQVEGSGPQGRVVKKDVEEHLAAPRPAPAPERPAEAPPEAPEKAPALPSLAPAEYGPPPQDERIPVSRLRGAIGRRMVQSKVEAPHFYVTHEYDVGALVELRREANAMLVGSGEKLSLNDFIVKAAALALRQFPNLNARLDGDEIVHFGQVNVGVAVAVEGGLLTVVCRDADRKPLRQISKELREMSGRVREGKVRPQDIEGSTFSTSNMGMFDVEHFTAIINPPEAAILAIGAARQVPVVAEGELAVGWRMKATLSVDHRVSDGAEGARYLQALAEYLENPLSLML